MFNHHAFVDGCDANEDVNMVFKYYEPKITKNAVKTGQFGNIDCSTMIDDENDSQEWSDVPISQKQFRCAQLKNQDSCETYVVCWISSY